MTTPTIGELIDFVVKNRQDKVFRGYTTYEIAGMILAGVKENSLYYSTSLDGRIDGMILAKVDVEKRVLWVEENLSMTLANLRKFAKKARVQFYGYDFQGFKCGSNRNYNRLLNKLSV